MDPRHVITAAAAATLLLCVCKQEADTAAPAPSSEPAKTEPAETSEANKPDPEAERAAAEAAAEAEKRALERFEAQADAGEAVYDKSCARCHGKEGQGKKGKYPAVIGDGALPVEPPKRAKTRKAEFRTGQELFAFVSGSMPPRKGGSLTDEQYLAVTAFIVKANGIDLRDELKEDNLEEIDIVRDTVDEDEE